MVSFSRFFFVILCAFSSLVAGASDLGIYKTELKELKKRPSHEIIFDKHANEALRDIVKDIDIQKELTNFQQYVYSLFLASNGAIVTKDTMPKLHGYIQSLCQAAQISMPMVFITRDKVFFNAFAQKLFISSGGILIGQDLINECSDDELEAIVAHEIGHIYHNHINKHLAVHAGSVLATVGAIVGCETLSDNIAKILRKVPAIQVVSIMIGSNILSSLIVGKRFEREADQFACIAGKSKGIIEFFEHLKQKEKKEDDDFAITDAALLNNQNLMQPNQYSGLRWRYNLAKFGHSLGKAFRWVYHNTPFGAHPSHDARIESAKKYNEQPAH